MGPNTETTILSLPPELLHQIFIHLSPPNSVPKTLLPITLVCHQWNQITISLLYGNLGTWRIFEDEVHEDEEENGEGKTGGVSKLIKTLKEDDERQKTHDYDDHLSPPPLRSLLKSLNVLQRGLPPSPSSTSSNSQSFPQPKSSPLLPLLQPPTHLLSLTYATFHPPRRHLTSMNSPTLLIDWWNSRDSNYEDGGGEGGMLKWLRELDISMAWIPTMVESESEALSVRVTDTGEILRTVRSQRRRGLRREENSVRALNDEDLEDGSDGDDEGERPFELAPFLKPLKELRKLKVHQQIVWKRLGSKHIFPLKHSLSSQGQHAVITNPTTLFLPQSHPFPLLPLLPFFRFTSSLDDLPKVGLVSLHLSHILNLSLFALFQTIVSVSDSLLNLTVKFSYPPPAASTSVGIGRTHLNGGAVNGVHNSESRSEAARRLSMNSMLLGRLEIVNQKNARRIFDWVKRSSSSDGTVSDGQPIELAPERSNGELASPSSSASHFQIFSLQLHVLCLLSLPPTSTSLSYLISLLLPNLQILNLRSSGSPVMTNRDLRRVLRVCRGLKILKLNWPTVMRFGLKGGNEESAKEEMDEDRALIRETIWMAVQMRRGASQWQPYRDPLDEDDGSLKSAGDLLPTSMKLLIGAFEGEDLKTWLASLPTPFDFALQTSRKGKAREDSGEVYPKPTLKIICTLFLDSRKPKTRFEQGRSSMALVLRRPNPWGERFEYDDDPPPQADNDGAEEEKMTEEQEDMLLVEKVKKLGRDKGIEIEVRDGSGIRDGTGVLVDGGGGNARAFY